RGTGPCHTAVSPGLRYPVLLPGKGRRESEGEAGIERPVERHPKPLLADPGSASRGIECSVDAVAQVLDQRLPVGDQPDIAGRKMAVERGATFIPRVIDIHPACDGPGDALLALAEACYRQTVVVAGVARPDTDTAAAVSHAPR